MACKFKLNTTYHVFWHNKYYNDEILVQKCIVVIVTKHFHMNLNIFLHFQCYLLRTNKNYNRALKIGMIIVHTNTIIIGWELHSNSPEFAFWLPWKHKFHNFIIFNKMLNDNLNLAKTMYKSYQPDKLRPLE